MIKPISMIFDDINESPFNQDSIIKTGINEIDNNYFGIIPAELWIIGAYTGSGKTHFCTQVALNVALKKRRVAYFSLEMSSASILFRMMGKLSNIYPSKLQFGMLSPEQFKFKEQTQELLKTLDEYLFIDDKNFQLEEIQKTIRDEMIAIERKPDLLIIDYLQLVQKQGSKDEYQRMTDAIIEIQRFAKETGIAFLIASQMSNEDAKMGVKSPILGYKGSGAIAHAADIGMLLVKDGLYDKESKIQNLHLHCKKNRRAEGLLFELELLYPSGKVQGKQHAI